MKSTHALACTCTAIAALWIAPVAAQTAESGSGPPPETLAVASSTGAFANPVSEDSLDTLRGGAQVSNDMQLNGTTADNSARNVNTGTNTIGTGSFANMSGLPVVIQNSGANVLIQNAVILNLQMN
ncbi:hypothetical protein QTI66_10480 [Variovorax sp. J22R133]|uniref:hypothetical protein n=1 Tax=Variovorax brevis TaxID=3053503 RepID=UPI0025785E58|nr:hypothetical protein [Variovorax sp. J22R133]MDM0112574.1 hypothetical protein [Variovorax sp. J22R133]